MDREGAGELVPTEEELRAEAWQRNQAQIIAKRRSIEAKLHGSGTARQQLHINWDPLDQWLRERGTVLPLDEDDD